jgi:predicted transcriptional regulator
MQLIPEKPLHEFWISIAGPLVNVVLAILLFGLLKVQGSTFSVETLLTLEPEAAAPRDMIAALMVINIALAAFNVLPAFPMDGGRILRSLLAHFMDDYARATQIASVVGQGMAFFFGTLGLLIFNPILLFIAFFVFFAARQEAFQSMLRSVLRGVRAKDVMMRRFRTLNAGATLTEAINELLNSTDTLFPVQGDTGIAGLLTRDQVLEALSQHEPTITHLADIVNSGCHIVDESEPVADFMSDLNDPRQEGILITRRGRPVGLITQESLQNWYALSAALQKFNLKPRRVDAAPLPMPALVEMT